LYINYNKITELPLSLLESKNLEIFECYCDSIENIHPLIEQWLIKMKNK